MPNAQAISKFDDFGNFLGIRGDDESELFSTGILHPYIGCVASRCGVPNQFVTANKQLMARSKHMAMDRIESLSVVYENYYVKRTTPVGETLTGGAGTYAAAIEYPSGTIAAVFTFKGSLTGTAADGEMIISDMVKVSIPAGATFFVRTWMSNPAGIVHCLGGGLNTAIGINASGESMTFGVTTPDLTQTPGNFANSSANYYFRPSALLSWTTKPSILIAGDSRLGNGVNNDAVNDGYGQVGEIEKAIGRRYATINAGCGGERMQQVAAGGYTRRKRLINFVSHGIVTYGINDISNLDALGARTSAQVLADMATVVSFFGGKPVYQATLSPVSTSTDAWATVGNQTTGGNNAQRVAFNDAIRFVPEVLSGYIEIADQTESARNSGLWKAGFTSDGIHGNATATNAVRDSGAVAIRSIE